MTTGCSLQKVPSWCPDLPHMVSGSRDSVQVQRLRELHLDLWQSRLGSQGHLLTCFVPLCTQECLLARLQLSHPFGLYKQPYP